MVLLLVVVDELLVVLLVVELLCEHGLDPLWLSSLDSLSLSSPVLLPPSSSLSVLLELDVVLVSLDDVLVSLDVVLLLVVLLWLSPGGPVWVWLVSPQPQPGRVPPFSPFPLLAIAIPAPAPVIPSKLRTAKIVMILDLTKNLPPVFGGFWRGSPAHTPGLVERRSRRPRVRGNPLLPVASSPRAFGGHTGFAKI